MLTLFAAVTVLAVMLGSVPAQRRWAWHRPGLMARGLFSVLIAVPAIALIVTRSLDLPRAVQIGIVMVANTACDDGESRLDSREVLMRGSECGDCSPEWIP